jgi:bifunctional UDP-N-acetylglucosamine pyrophosphorylase/glucosamine-1-phosphate N-acetyltransferase
MGTQFAMDLTIVILAAGKGSRMHSDIPKVLHPLAGKPILSHVLSTAWALDPVSVITVVGHGESKIRGAIDHPHCAWVQQSEQLGTAHAVQQTLPHIKTDRVLVLLGDVPLITPETLRHFIKTTPMNALGMITYIPESPRGLGRILRDEYQSILGVVEERDATEAQRLIPEVASGIYLARLQDLKAWIPAVNKSEASHEYYLPDIVPMAIKASSVVGMCLKDPQEALGINNKTQLAMAERCLQKRYVDTLLHQGVTILDPARLDIRGEVKAGQDVVIDVNVILEGKITLGDRSHIGTGCVLKDVELGADSAILPHSVIEGAVFANQVQVGPFARVRPGTVLAEGAKIGNFVEVKKSTFGPHTKANHLSYIGNATLGAHVNVGAGTITCNYDGVHKFETIIGDEVFIGSNSSLVAPVKIGKGATIGAGTVLTKDAPENQLTLSRAKQSSHPNWQRPESETDHSDKEV